MSSIQADDLCESVKDCFSFNLKFMVLVGLWRNKDWSKTQTKLYTAYEMILHVNPIIYLIITCIGMYEHRAELTSLLSNLDKNMVALQFVVKYIIIVIKRKDIDVLITEMMHSGDKLSKKCVRLMSMHVIVITSLTTFTVSAFSGASLLEGEMIVDAWFPFDPLKNFNNLFLAFQISAVLFLPCTFRGNAMQGLTCSMIMYLCEQFKDLQTRIRALKYAKGNDVYLEEQFKLIVIKHIRVMRYSETMKNIFKEYFFVQNLAITLELCLNAVMITVVGLNEKKSLVNFAVFLAVALLNAYIYCYLGNEMIIQSEGIAQAAYDAEWTSWPVAMQKNLLIVIRASQKPLCLSAGGMANMSMQTFGQALYNGYSIFAVLNDAVD